MHTQKKEQAKAKGKQGTFHTITYLKKSILIRCYVPSICPWVARLCNLA